MEVAEAEGSVKIKKSTFKVDFFGAPGGIRTPDLEVRSLAFYPAKLRAHYLIYYTVNLGIFQVYLEKIPKYLKETSERYLIRLDKENKL